MFLLDRVVVFAAWPRVVLCMMLYVFLDLFAGFHLFVFWRLLRMLPVLALRLLLVVFCSSPAGTGAANSLRKNAPAWSATEAYESPLLAKRRRTAHGVPRTRAVSPFGTEER